MTNAAILFGMRIMSSRSGSKKGIRSLSLNSSRGGQKAQSVSHSDRDARNYSWSRSATMALSNSINRTKRDELDPKSRSENGD